MSEFEKEEALWEPETGMENRQDQPSAENLQEVQVGEIQEEEFEIPDIPAVFSVPEVSAPAPTEEVKEEPRVWNAKTAKQQIKEVKKKYKLEKKRLRRERRMRGPGRGKLLLTGLLCGLLGAALGAVATWFMLTMT